MTSAEILTLIEHDISSTSRLRAVAAVIGGVGMAVTLALLWITEPAPLPGRTAVAFAVMIVIGLSWTAHGVWVIANRRPLYARDSIVAGRMATGFAALFTVAAVAISSGQGTPPIGIALAVGLVMVAAGITVWRTGVRRRVRLLELRKALETHPR